MKNSFTFYSVRAAEQLLTVRRVQCPELEYEKFSFHSGIQYKMWEDICMWDSLSYVSIRHFSPASWISGSRRPKSGR
jgi:hypothetical protein